MTIGIFVFANAQNYGTLLLSQLIIAVGACSGFVGAGYVGGQWFGMAKFSFMFGLVQFAASFFSAFNQNLLSLALTKVPWRELFNVIGFFGIILFVLGAIFIRNPTPIARPAESITAFFAAVAKGIVEVAKIPHVWVASAFGALCFGVMLGLGVVWAPKLLAARGFDAASANWSASLLWLGLAAGCFVVPKWSDVVKSRKLPIIVGIVVQALALALLLYLPELNLFAAMVLCFAFGFGNAAHMLAFSTAADVVTPSQIGTSAAIVNGIMFIVGGIMISRPGVRIGLGIEAGIDPTSRARAIRGPAIDVGYSRRAGNRVLYPRDLSAIAFTLGDPRGENFDLGFDLKSAKALRLAMSFTLIAPETSKRLCCGARARNWQCAPKARTISGGRIDPESCRSPGASGWAAGILGRAGRRTMQAASSSGPPGWSSAPSPTGSTVAALVAAL